MRVVSLLLCLSFLLAGCTSSGSSKGDEVFITSELPDVEATSEDGAPDPVTATPKKGTRGHIAGVVVDEAIRPIEGATVRLPGMDLTDVTDRNGGFSFADLHPGPYLINANSTGYYKAETVVTVKSDDFSRVKFMLTGIPPPEPYHFTVKYEGFTDITDLSLFTLVSTCNTCFFNFYAGGPGFRAMLIEATMEEYTGTGGVGSNNFAVQLRPSDNCCSYFSSGDYPNPARILVKTPDIPEEELAYRLQVRPEAFPTPEISKEFQVYVSYWFNEDPPTEWSFLNGDE